MSALNGSSVLRLSEALNDFLNTKFKFCVRVLGVFFLVGWGFCLVVVFCSWVVVFWGLLWCFVCALFNFHFVLWVSLSCRGFCYGLQVLQHHCTGEVPS